MKLKIISIAAIAFFPLLVYNINAGLKSYSGYLVTKDGKVFRSTDMGWSWNELKKSGPIDLHRSKIFSRCDNGFEFIESENYTISVFDIFGAEVLNCVLPGKLLPVKIESFKEFKELPRGLYFVRYRCNKSFFYGKLLKY